MRLAARGYALVRSHRGVAVNQLDALKRNAKLLRDQLDLRRRNALSKFRLAGVSGHAAVGADCNPRIQLIVRRADLAAFELRGGGGNKAAHAEGDDQRARALQKAA